MSEEKAREATLMKKQLECQSLKMLLEMKDLDSAKFQYLHNMNIQRISDLVYMQYTVH